MKSTWNLYEDQAHIARMNTINTTVSAEAPSAHYGMKEAFPKLMIGAIGVVFGDIGTSPLYALKESPRSAVPPRCRRTAHLRRAQPDLLVDDDGRHDQICLHHHARRQQGRRRQPRAARADRSADLGQAAAPQRWLLLGAVRDRPVLRRRDDHPGDLGAVGGRGPGDRQRRVPAATSCRSRSAS